MNEYTEENRGCVTFSLKLLARNCLRRHSIKLFLWPRGNTATIVPSKDFINAPFVSVV
jgi:hypothetical protein